MEREERDIVQIQRRSKQFSGQLPFVHWLLKDLNQKSAFPPHAGFLFPGSSRRAMAPCKQTGSCLLSLPESGTVASELFGTPRALISPPRGILRRLKPSTRCGNDSRQNGPLSSRGHHNEAIARKGHADYGKARSIQVAFKRHLALEARYARNALCYLVVPCLEVRRVSPDGRTGDCGAVAQVGPGLFT